MTQDKHKQHFSVQRIYIKDLSFEAPLGAKVFTEKQQPAINQELNTHIKKIQDDHYEVTLTVIITAKIEEQTVFLVEVHQAGLFFISGVTGTQLPQVLNTTCPNILLPYAREVIDSTLVKGTFPPIMLSPINFEALYAQVIEKQKEKQNTAEIH